MSELHKAYSVLGIEIGSQLDVVNRHYKSLALTWHPDRFPAKEAKIAAEEELKRINHARDALREHFSSGGHIETGACTCRAEPAKEKPRSRPGAGTSESSYSRSNTAGTKEQSGQSARKQGDDFRNSYRQEDTESACHSPSPGQGFHSSFRTGVARPKDDGIRCNISPSCAACFVLLLLVSLVSDTLMQLIRACLG